MSILINRNTKIICQGLTGEKGTFHAKKMLEYGTKLVAGVTPGKGGSVHLGLPVFNTVQEVMNIMSIDASIIYVPAPFCKDSILESIFAGIKLIVCITEGIPILDMLEIKYYLEINNKSNLIGPNCPGIITPNECIMGIMPTNIHKSGTIGVVSRSGTLTYEAVKHITENGFGQSTCVGIGGDPILGMNFIDILRLFEQDINTEAIVLVGEIGGNSEEESAQYIKKYITKPIISYIAGFTAPIGKQMGHAGAIINDKNHGTAFKKFEALRDVGVKVVRSPEEIGKILKTVL